MTDLKAFSEQKMKGKKMTKTKHASGKHLTETEIKLFCQGVEEVLKKINDRCSHKGSKESKEKKEAKEEVSVTCHK